MKYILLILLLLCMPLQAKEMNFPCVIGDSCEPVKELKKYYAELAQLDEVMDVEANLDAIGFTTFHSSEFGLLVSLTVGRFSTLFVYSQERLGLGDLRQFSFKLETGLLSGVQFNNKQVSVEIYSNNGSEAPYTIQLLNLDGEIVKK